MPEMELTYTRGIRCNGSRGCTARLTIEDVPTLKGHRHVIRNEDGDLMVDRWSKAVDTLKEHAQSLGWQRWISNTIYDYCPDHRPGPVHKMRRLW
jgi:hypothetical protein